MEVVEGPAIAGLRNKYKNLAGPSAPLFVLVHGRAGTFDVMWAFNRVLPPNCNVVAPQAPLGDGSGFSWWQIGLSKEDTLRAASTAADQLGAFIDQYIAEHSLTPSRVVLVGFSQGGALVSVALQKGITAHGAALLASFAIRVEDATSVRVPIFIAHGSADEIVPVGKAEWTKSYLESLGAQVELIVDDVGHKVGVSGMKGLGDWCARRVSAE